MRELKPGEEVREDALDTPPSDAAGSMAWHSGLEPPCELSCAAARPSPDHHRGNCNGSQASYRGDLILR
eukprot:5046577-Alexandrium_andersonii.AAC.1